MGKSAEWEQLYAAIGRVAAQSAQNDDHMREVFFAILWSDSAWILAEGQPTEWLCSTLPVLLHLEDSGYERWPRAMHDEVIGAIKQIKSLHAHRNTIIHSTWRKGLIEREEDTVTRPWGKRDDQVPWAAFRSRQRVYAPHSEWTISDIELLADKMTDAGEALMRDFARMYQHAHPFIIADTKWVRVAAD